MGEERKEEGMGKKMREGRRKVCLLLDGGLVTPCPCLSPHSSVAPCPSIKKYAPAAVSGTRPQRQTIFGSFIRSFFAILRVF